MATQIAGRGGSLKKAEIAGNRYQGSVGSSGFEPVKAVSEEKAAKQKTQAVESENNIKRRALERQQQADTLNLNAKQKAISSKQTLDQKVELGELKQDQLYEKSVFDLKKSWVTLQDNLKLSELKAQHTVESTNLKTINSIIQLSTSFAKSYLSYSEQMGEVREQEAAVKLFFDGGSASVFKEAANVEDSNTTKEAITAEANIEAADGDISVQNSLNNENSQARTERIFNKKSAFEFARDFLALYRDEWQNSDLKIELEDGRVISPQDAQTAEEVNAVGLAIASELATRFGLKDLDAEVVYRVVLPKVNEARSQVDTAITADVIKANVENAVAVEVENALKKMESKEYDMQEVFDGLYKGIFISGKHRGDKGAITNEVVTELVKALEATQDLDGLQKLAEVVKVPGNKGTALGKIGETSKAINDAIARVRSYDHDQMQLEIKQRAVEIESAKTTHKEELLDAGNDIEKIIAANSKYEDRLTKIGGAKALELYQTHANKDDRHNPFLVGYYQKLTNDGKRISEKELDANVANGAMTEEDKTKVMNNAGLTKEGADLAVKPYQSSWGDTLEARIIQGAAITGINPTVAGKLVNIVKEDMLGEVNRQMADYLEENPDATRGDINNEAISVIETIVKNKIDKKQVYTSTGVFNSKNYEFFSGSRRREAMEVKTKVVRKADGSVDYSEYRLDLTDHSGEEILSYGEFGADPTRDKIFSIEEVTNAIEIARNNDWENADQRFIQIAEYFDMTPNQLLKAVAGQRGIDLEKYLKVDSKSEEAAKPLTMDTGVSAIKSFGFSEKGAKGLSVVLQTQGKWTELNKGNLGEIILEMQDNYPEAYRIFTSPTSTQRQIQRAAIEWGGYEIGIKAMSYDFDKYNDLLKQLNNEPRR